MTTEESASSGDSEGGAKGAMQQAQGSKGVRQSV
jgi:hypothetical protein